MKPRNNRRRHAQSTNVGSSYKEQIERQALEKKSIQSGTAKTGSPVREMYNNNALVKSPTSIGNGVVKIPEGTPEAEVIKVTINSSEQTADQVVVIGNDAIYKAKGDKTFGGNKDGMIANEALYNLWLNDVKVNTYIFHMVSLSVTALTYPDGANPPIAQTEAVALAQLYEEWSYVRGDVQGRYSTQTMDLRDARNPFQEDKSVIWYTFKEGENRLDALSAYVIPKFRKGLEMEVRFHTTVVVNGRH